MADLTRLKGSERVRKRVSVMMGSDDIRGCQHTLFEILSNSIDRFRKGYGNYIKIIKHKDLSYTIIDRADGLPMDWNEKENAYNWDLALKVLYAGDNYNSNSTALGLNGLGLCSSQYASEFMNVISYKNNKKYIVKFKKGRPIHKDTNEFVCEDDDTLLSKELGRQVLYIENNQENKHGTIIHYKPDLEVFTDINISIDWINNKINKQAMVNKGLTIEVYDEINDQLYTHFYEKGIKDYIKTISNNEDFSDVIYFEDKGRGRDKKEKPEYEYNYEIAFVFNNEINKLEYFHNSSELLHGGSTADAINLAFTNAIHDYAKRNSLYNKKENKIKFTDIEDSLICIISSFSTMTSYANQTKLSIDNKFIKDFTYESLKEKLSIYFIEHQPQANKIVNQILINKRSREKSEKSRVQIKKELSENITSSINRPKKFVPCRSKNPNEIELVLIEGDSAMNSVKLARDPNYMCIYPLKGKPINAVKNKLNSVLQNQEIKDIFKILGCGMLHNNKKIKGVPEFDINKLKINNILISTDFDDDGFHIQALLIGLFYTLAPDLIKQGRINILYSPLYIIKTKDKEIFAYSEKEKNNILKNLNTESYKITRYKGLGGLPVKAMAKAMNKEYRLMKQITMNDVNKSIDIIKLFLSEEQAKNRKEYIENYGDQYFDYSIFD